MAERSRSGGSEGSAVFHLEVGRSNKDQPAHFEAAEPAKGSAAFLFVRHVVTQRAHAMNEVSPCKQTRSDRAESDIDPPTTNR